MKSKTLVSGLLLGFVAVSLFFALRKIGPTAEPSADQTVAQESTSPQTSVDLTAKLAEAQFSAVYFHAPHRCPTCRKIESFTHESLAAEIESGKVAWQTADYTADANASLVDRFDVFTSTVVLVEVQAGEITRWKNLENVWNYTSDQADFTAYINQAWNEFKAS